MSLTLSQAEKLIRSRLGVLAAVKVPLSRALGRVCSSDLQALHPSPSFRRSLYDGYAIGTVQGVRENTLSWPVAGLIAAGDGRARRLRNGRCWKVMTGAPVPAGTWKVIPQERCRYDNGRVYIAGETVEKEPAHIQARGDEIRKGAVLARRGQRITPQDMLKLAEGGWEEIEVFCRPHLGYFCTGSELVRSPRGQARGKTISSNRHLLAGLAEDSGFAACDLGIAADSLEALQHHIRQAKEAGVQVIISTGGMGPGKYDLVGEAFRREKGETLFTSLRLRPGKATLAGMLGRTMYFGLPGPPAAVAPLYCALVLPALESLQAMGRRPLPQARLAENLDLGRTGPQRLIPALLWQRDGINYARGTARGETANGYLFCPAGRKVLRRGEVLRVRKPGLP